MQYKKVAVVFDGDLLSGECLGWATAGAEFLFGTAPNIFLRSQHGLLKRGQTCLAIADGEGRNGIWLAEQGLQVHSIDSSEVALRKAKRLAQERKVATVTFEQADLFQWSWGESRFDVVAAIFIQFMGQIKGKNFLKISRIVSSRVDYFYFMDIRHANWSMGQAGRRKWTTSIPK